MASLIESVNTTTKLANGQSAASAPTAEATNTNNNNQFVACKPEERAIVAEVLQRSAHKKLAKIGSCVDSNTMPTVSTSTTARRVFGGESAANQAHSTRSTTALSKDGAKESASVANAAKKTRRSDPANKENIGTTTVVEVPDLDAEDMQDPLMVAEYVKDIMQYLWQLESKHLPSASYMEQQKEINWSMRSILVDWLIEVQWKLRLLPETLFLSINLIDRFLSKRAVSLVKLQLVGLTATLIASKVEEVLAPSVSNFIYLADNAYDQGELLKAERYMLSVYRDYLMIL